MEALGKCKCFTKFQYSSLCQGQDKTISHLVQLHLALEAGASPLVPKHLLLTNAICGRRGPAPLPWASLEHLLLDQVSIVPRRSGQSGWAAVEGTAETLGMDIHFMGTPVAIDAVSCQWHPPPPARPLSLVQFSASESWGDLSRNSPSERSLSKQQCLGPCRFTNGL